MIIVSPTTFASIVAAVREGRTVYDNLTKVIGWTLPTNGAPVAMGAPFDPLKPAEPKKSDEADKDTTPAGKEGALDRKIVNGGIVILQFAFTYLPVMQRLFQTRSIGLGDGLVIVGVGIVLLCVLEVENRARRALLARDWLGRTLHFRGSALLTSGEPDVRTHRK
jgi:hypothetical protein